MKVLIVDDEPLVRRSLTKAFEIRGHQVIAAEKGDEGLKLWRAETPDVVMLDVLMPGMSGPDVLREIGDAKSGIVYLMSAYSGEHNMLTARNLGADHFIPKPFENIFAIVDMVEQSVQNRDSESGLEPERG